MSHFSNLISLFTLVASLQLLWLPCYSWNIPNTFFPPCLCPYCSLCQKNLPSNIHRLPPYFLYASVNCQLPGIYLRYHVLPIPLCLPTLFYFSSSFSLPHMWFFAYCLFTLPLPLKHELLRATTLFYSLLHPHCLEQCLALS